MTDGVVDKSTDNSRGSSPSSSSSLRRRVTHVLTSSDTAERLQRRTTATTGLAVAGEHAMELEYEEWDPSTTPFYQHCIAGSLAGFAEHLLMYPIDTIKTHVQTAAVTATTEGTVVPPTSMTTLLRRHLVSTEAFGKLWRGAQAMASGCIPAHAMYFSSYEAVKAYFLARQEDSDTILGPMGSTVAGATAALSHDMIMVPADTIKQRLQLGYYTGMTNAFVHMFRHEGLTGLYRALPVTLLTNLPYGAVMVTTNETLRGWLMGSGGHAESSEPQLTIQTTLIAGSGAGMAAAAITAPLDRLKTKLQTQGLAVAQSATSAPSFTPQYKGLMEAFESVVRHEGHMGLFRGVVPRVVTHTPSVAISWTVYEVMKVWLSGSAATTA